MNPFAYPEFWLSLAFFVVLGFMFVSPVRRSLKKFFDAHRQDIENKIQESQSVYHQAFQEYKSLSKELKKKIEDKEIKIKIKQIQQEFLQKEENLVKAKEQDFQVRQNILIMQTKENLKKQLLDQAEEQVLNSKKLGRSSSRDLDHFIKMLCKNEEKLKKL